MKIWVSIFLCFFSAKVFASSADSGRCPWKMPFTIRVHAIGTNSSSEINSEPHGGSSEYCSPTLDTQDFNFTIDTAIFSAIRIEDSNVSTAYSVHQDTLRYSYSYIDTSGAPYYSMQSGSATI